MSRVHADALIADAEALVKQAMAENDPSHDWLHVNRVRALALGIAGTLSVDMQVVELSALFHDLADRKYSAVGSVASLIEPFLAAHADQVSEAHRELVVRICDNVSYSKEVKRRAAGLETDWHRDCLELHCVQDADKLDAMGATGTLCPRDSLTSQGSCAARRTRRSSVGRSSAVKAAMPLRTSTTSS